MECLPQQKEIAMLVLTRRPGESLVLNLPDDLGLEPIEVTILGDGKIGVDAPDDVAIIRAELLNRDEVHTSPDSI
jgi:carbon storage regulator CsrA